MALGRQHDDKAAMQEFNEAHRLDPKLIAPGGLPK
jgi:hypothetical protein